MLWASTYSTLSHQSGRCKCRSVVQVWNQSLQFSILCMFTVSTGSEADRCCERVQWGGGGQDLQVPVAAGSREGCGCPPPASFCPKNRNSQCDHHHALLFFIFMICISTGVACMQVSMHSCMCGSANVYVGACSCEYLVYMWRPQVYIGHLHCSLSTVFNWGRV